MYATMVTRTERIVLEIGRLDWADRAYHVNGRLDLAGGRAYRTEKSGQRAERIMLGAAGGRQSV